MRQWSWLAIPLVGVLLLVAVSLPSESPTPEASPSAPPASENRTEQEAKVMREWARKTGGDFDKLPPDVQQFINQVSMGHGREWLRKEAERQQKEAVKQKQQKGDDSKSK